MKLLALTLVTVFWACTSTAPDSLDGLWGGPHIAMFVDADSAFIEYDCAHGWISERLDPDSDGEFEADGQHVAEHGGPVQDGEVPDPRPARYFGRVTGSLMVLRVELTEEQGTLGLYQLRRGAVPEVFKCL